MAALRNGKINLNGCVKINLIYLGKINLICPGNFNSKNAVTTISKLP
jgi:hypothetical protein